MDTTVGESRRVRFTIDLPPQFTYEGSWNWERSTSDHKTFVGVYPKRPSHKGLKGREFGPAVLSEGPVNRLLPTADGKWVLWCQAASQDDTAEAQERILAICNSLALADSTTPSPPESGPMMRLFGKRPDPDPAFQYSIQVAYPHSRLLRFDKDVVLQFAFFDLPPETCSRESADGNAALTFVDALELGKRQVSAELSTISRRPQVYEFSGDLEVTASGETVEGEVRLEGPLRGHPDYDGWIRGTFSAPVLDCRGGSGEPPR